MKYTLIILIISIVLSSGCLNESEGPKGAGSPCITDNQCYDGVSCIFDEKNQGFCNCSGESVQCMANEDCCNDMACRNETCVKLSDYCILTILTPGLGILGIIVVIFGVVLWVLLILLGVNQKQTVTIQKGTITITGVCIILIILGIFMFLANYGINNLC